MTALDTPRRSEPTGGADVELRALRRRYVLAAGAGALVATLLFLVVLQSGRGGLFDRDLLGGFYDGQARSLLDGRLDVPEEVAGFEGFRMEGETHIYQGIAPALARLPLLAATDRFDGELTGVSMLLAFVTTCGYLVAAGWRTRRCIRGLAPLGGAELALTAVATFGMAAAPLLFLASRAWVYHEALAWGAATCLAAFTHLVFWLTAPAMDPEAGLDAGPGGRRHGWHLPAAVAAAGLALNTRSSIGAGPMVAVALVGALLAVDVLVGRTGADGFAGRLSRAVQGRARRTAGWRPAVAPNAGRALVVVLVGSVAAVVVYTSVNHARFGSLVGVPLDRQALVATDPARQEALAANDGSLFGAQYAPSVLTQILRPDALGIRSVFPFLGFPPQRPTVLGDAVFAERDWSSSIPASQPLLFLTAIAGTAVLIAPRRFLRRGDDVQALRIPVLGAAVGSSAIVIFGYMAQRYLTDLYPYLVLTGLVGLHAVAAALAPADRPRPARTYAVAATAVVVVATSLWTAWANTGLALQYNQEVAPGPTESQRIAWVRTQSRWGGAPEVLRVAPGEALPLRQPVGLLAVVGECDALYRSNGTIWYRLESSPPAGRTRVELRRTATPATEPIPEPAADEVIARSTDGDETAELVLGSTGDGTARFFVEVQRGGRTERSPAGPELAWEPGQTLPLELTFDWRTGEALVTRTDDGAELLNVLLELPAAGLETVQGRGVEVTPRPVTTPLCDELAR